MDRRLPPHTRRALAALWRAIEDSEHDQRQGLPEDHARRVLAALDEAENRERFDPLPADEVDYRLEFLHNRGEIYYVDDWIRITSPEEVEAEIINEDNYTESSG